MADKLFEELGFEEKGFEVAAALLDAMSVRGVPVDDGFTRFRARASSSMALFDRSPIYC